MKLTRRDVFPFVLGALLGTLITFSAIQISALVMARQMWLNQHDGLKEAAESLLHPRSPEDSLLPPSFPTFLGSTLDQWPLQTSSGGSINVASSKGKVVFLNLWATWCAPCVAELPSIQRLRDSLRSEPNVEFMLVTDEDPAIVNRFIKNHGIELRVYVRAKDLPKPLQYTGVPATYVLDRTGRIIYAHGSAANWDSQNVRSLLRNLAN
jgi:thiol-disulfide isomerase/thioredoxin